ncbi:hypothetical protein DFR75_102428 [Nocardia ignorata]|uniref:Uncharacterized protein n=1 Tax=Nocardia ignorata TaxID=145285 RepID=A0A4R6PP78_NOCIG|nr:hypothetical protein DFR75_102428 [Nocardia ignorata]
MSSTHSYSRDRFLAEFFPDVNERRVVEEGARRIVAAGFQRFSGVSAGEGVGVANFSGEFDDVGDGFAGDAHFGADAAG